MLRDRDALAEGGRIKMPKTMAANRAGIIGNQSVVLSNKKRVTCSEHEIEKISARNPDKPRYPKAQEDLGNQASLKSPLKIIDTRLFDSFCIYVPFQAFTKMCFYGSQTPIYRSSPELGGGKIAPKSKF